MKLLKEDFIKWLDDSSLVFDREQDFLTDLDREIGDADHGLNMNRGFKKVKDKLPSLSDKDIGTIMKTAGMTLLSSIGGASGPLNSSFFIRCAGSTVSKEELDLLELTKMLEDGAEGIVQRGKAELGDKTMVDTWLQIISCLKANKSLPLIEALDLAVAKAEEAALGTIPMIAKKGRASYLGDRSAGHQDPGATSAYLLFRTLRDVIKKRI